MNNKEWIIFKKACDISLKYHDGQKDKGGNHYILHPLRVSDAFDSYKEKVVAILHDVVEDTEVTLDFLRSQGFENEIIDAIDSLTRRDNESYMDFIRRTKDNDVARVVKIADIKDNMDLSRIPNPTSEDLKRIEKYKKALKLLEDKNE